MFFDSNLEALQHPNDLVDEIPKIVCLSKSSDGFEKWFFF